MGWAKNGDENGGFMPRASRVLAIVGKDGDEKWTEVVERNWEDS
jgi:hypothetical protein